MNRVSGTLPRFIAFQKYKPPQIGDLDTSWTMRMPSFPNTAHGPGHLLCESEILFSSIFRSLKIIFWYPVPYSVVAQARVREAKDLPIS